MSRNSIGLGQVYEEEKRAARILQLIQMITAAPKRYLRRDLAAHFGISERMIQKDLQVVRYGLNLSLSHTREGYYFEEVPQLPALRYTFTEALSLLLAVQSARQISGIGSAELAAAAARLEALFPEEFTPMLRQVASPPARTAQREHRERMLMLLNWALAQNRKVQMTYETRSRAGEVNERVVRPYHLMPYVRSWQLVAYCEWRQDELMFKVDRIQEAELLDAHYTIPDDFDVDEYMGPAWGILRGEAGEPEDVMLRFEPATGHRVTEEYWGVEMESEEQADGQVLVKLHVGITPEFVKWLLYYGSDVEVLAPAGLRVRVAEEHLRALERNSEMTAGG